MTTRISVRFGAYRMGIRCITRIFSARVRTHLPLSIVPCAENKIRLANVKIWEQGKHGERAMGLGSPYTEKNNDGDREGRAGRRIAELRLVEGFSGRWFHLRSMAQGRGLRPVQRRRGVRRYRKMDRRMRGRLCRGSWHR